MASSTTDGRMWFLTVVGRNLRTLAFIQQSTGDQIQRIRETPYETKDQMKMVGGTANEVASKLVEFHILGMAKTVEDLLWAIADSGGKPKNFWKELNDKLFFDEVAMIRHLANTIKHNGGYITEDSGKTSHELIQNYGFSDGTPIGDWGAGFAQGPPYGPLKLLYYVQEFCFSVIASECGVGGLGTQWADEDIERKIINRWLGDFPAVAQA